MDVLIRQIENYIRRNKKVLVAFSGGVDSALLAVLANSVLKNNAFIYTIVTPYMSEEETNRAITFAQKHQMNHKLLHLDTPKEIMQNPTDRCYLCKQHLFHLLKKEANRINADMICDGSNADDTKDYRPGMKALKELKIASPFLELGITKRQIRDLSTFLKLETRNTPSNPCLLTRLPYNQTVTKKAIEQVEQAELFLKEKGFKEVRVRHEGRTARIELVSTDQLKVLAPAMAKETTNKFKQIGFTFIALDLKPFSSGSMNEAIN